MLAALAAVARRMKPPCGQVGHGEFGAGEWIGDEQALVWGRSESDSEEREKGEQVGRHGGETRWRGEGRDGVGRQTNHTCRMLVKMVPKTSADSQMFSCCESNDRNHASRLVSCAENSSKQVCRFADVFRLLTCRRKTIPRARFPPRSEHEKGFGA